MRTAAAPTKAVRRSTAVAMLVYTGRPYRLFRGCFVSRGGVICHETREVAMRAVKLLSVAGLIFGLAACSNELKISAVAPAQGTFAGGEDVVIQGNGFQPGRGGVTVKFGKRDATAVVVAAADKIHVT